MTDRELFKMALYTLRHLCLHSRAVQGYNGEQVQAGIDALKARLAQLELPNRFNPDWDAMAVMVEEQQRMAKRIEELTQLVTSQGIRLMDAEAQPEPEPVAGELTEVILNSIRDSSEVVAPPRREWIGLTEEEIIRLRHLYDPTAHWSLDMFARVIEAKLKEKNG